MFNHIIYKTMLRRDRFLPRVDLNNEHYEFNTGWQRVVKSQSETKKDELNLNFQKLNQEFQEIKTQIELIKSVYKDDIRNHDNYEKLNESINLLEASLESFKKEVDIEIEKLNKKIEEQVTNIGRDIELIQNTLNLVLGRIDDISHKNSSILNIFKR